MLRAALNLAERGLAVFPCKAQDKRPATAHGVKDATKQAGVIERWWRQHPDYNIGVACGAISGIVVIDIDGLDAEAALRKLETEHADLPATVEAITARGRHLFFRYPERAVKNSAGKIAAGVDVRGDGGYIVAPPSIHPSGKQYCWSVDSAANFAALPSWLLEQIAEPTRNSAATPRADWRALIHAGVDEGGRNSTVARVVGHLLRKHVEPLVVLEIAIAFNEARCRPPLPPGEIAIIVNSIAAREVKRRQP